MRHSAVIDLSMQEITRLHNEDDYTSTNIYNVG
jgi:hypothetical protein